MIGGTKIKESRRNFSHYTSWTSPIQEAPSSPIISHPLKTFKNHQKTVFFKPALQIYGADLYNFTKALNNGRRLLKRNRNVALNKQESL